MQLPQTAPDAQDMTTIAPYKSFALSHTIGRFIAHECQTWAEQLPQQRQKSVRNFSNPHLQDCNNHEIRRSDEGSVIHELEHLVQYMMIGGPSPFSVSPCWAVLYSWCVPSCIIQTQLSCWCALLSWRENHPFRSPMHAFFFTNQQSTDTPWFSSAIYIIQQTNHCSSCAFSTAGPWSTLLTSAGGLGSDGCCKTRQ